MFELLRGLFSNEMAIDLGTATTLIYSRGKGIVLCEPSTIALETDFRGTQSVCAVGTHANKMVGRTPGAIDAVRPMRGGVIADFDITRMMLSDFMRRANAGRPSMRRVVIAVPCGITQVERRAVKEATLRAGARDVTLIEQPMAGAIGAGLDVSQPFGSMVVDIGGGTTEIAVISSHGVVYSESSRIGGNLMDEAIVETVRERYGLLIGERTAEHIKTEIGSAHPASELISTIVKGQDVAESVPRTIEIKSDEICEALMAPVGKIVERVRVTLKRIPPEISADIADQGILLVGGGSMLLNLDVLISERTGLKVRIAEDPQKCVALGAGRCLEERGLLDKVRISV
jgi:rod shape-determining protein MreB